MDMDMNMAIVMDIVIITSIVFTTMMSIAAVVHVRGKANAALAYFYESTIPIWPVSARWPAPSIPPVAAPQLLPTLNRPHPPECRCRHATPTATVGLECHGPAVCLARFGPFRRGSPSSALELHIVDSLPRLAGVLRRCACLRLLALGNYSGLAVSSQPHSHSLLVPVILDPTCLTAYTPPSTPYPFATTSIYNLFRFSRQSSCTPGPPTTPTTQPHTLHSPSSAQCSSQSPRYSPPNNPLRPPWTTTPSCPRTRLLQPPRLASQSLARCELLAMLAPVPRSSATKSGLHANAAPTCPSAATTHHP
jgi:hypothetical protein